MRQLLIEFWSLALHQRLLVGIACTLSHLQGKKASYLCSLGIQALSWKPSCLDTVDAVSNNCEHCKSSVCKFDFELLWASEEHATQGSSGVSIHLAEGTPQSTSCLLQAELIGSCLLQAEIVEAWRGSGSSIGLAIVELGRLFVPWLSVLSSRLGQEALAVA